MNTKLTMQAAEIVGLRLRREFFVEDIPAAMQIRLRQLDAAERLRHPWRI